MASLNDALTIARSGILTHQERIAIISHNISNVDTKGYHRQKALLGTNPPNEPNLYTTRNYDIGTGVRIDSVVRLQDQLRENLLLGQNSTLEYHNTLGGVLDDLESMLDGLDDGSLTTRLEEFWSSWQDLANNADRLAYRTTVLEKSAALTSTFNLLSSRLTEYRTAIADGGVGPTFTGSAARDVESVNNLATRLQSLNQRITSMDAQGINANDLKDQRDVIIRDLTELTNLSVGPDFSVRIDGQLLVSGDGTTRNTLSLTNTGSIPMELMLDGAVVDVSGGSIGGWVGAAAEIDAIQTDLDTMANTLITAVNTIHQSGYDLDGNPGVEFFTGAGAAGIQVNPLLYNTTNPQLNNPRLIAAANTVHDPGPPVVPNVGDGANALEISDLCRTQMVGLNNATFSDWFSNMMSDLGAAAQDEDALATDSKAVVDMLDAAIQSENGVNLDEELVEMINAQRAYESSARMLTTIDELLDVIINRLGA